MQRKRKTPRSGRAGKASLWVIKAGSEMVVGGGPLLIRHWMQQLAELRQKRGVRAIWVTSGAIALARKEMRRSWSKLPEKQALSALGQPLVMDAYSLALRTHGIAAAQVLLTYDDMADAKRSRNLKNTLRTLLHWDAVPILNENDAVATEEIKFGDNDSLSARVAQMMRADRLIIMTDVAGLYDKDPKARPDARLIQTVPRRHSQARAGLLGQIDATGKSRNGVGGMRSKIQAALAAQQSGIPTWLIQGDAPNGLLRLGKGEEIGTHFEGKARR
jgi:glutamate 5-kinase